MEGGQAIAATDFQGLSDGGIVFNDGEYELALFAVNCAGQLVRASALADNKPGVVNFLNDGFLD